MINIAINRYLSITSLRRCYFILKTPITFWANSSTTNHVQTNYQIFFQWGILWLSHKLYSLALLLSWQNIWQLLLPCGMPCSLPTMTGSGERCLCVCCACSRCRPCWGTWTLAVLQHFQNLNKSPPGFSTRVHPIYILFIHIQREERMSVPDTSAIDIDEMKRGDGKSFSLLWAGFFFRQFQETHATILI